MPGCLLSDRSRSHRGEGDGSRRRRRGLLFSLRPTAAPRPTARAPARLQRRASRPQAALPAPPSRGCSRAYSSVRIWPANVGGRQYLTLPNLADACQVYFGTRPPLAAGPAAASATQRYGPGPLTAPAGRELVLSTLSCRSRFSEPSCQANLDSPCFASWKLPLVNTRTRPRAVVSDWQLCGVLSQMAGTMSVESQVPDSAVNDRYRRDFTSSPAPKDYRPQ